MYFQHDKHFIYYAHFYYCQTTTGCYLERVEEEIQNMRIKFAELKNAICVALNNAGISMYELLQTVHGLPVQLEGLQAQIEPATINQMFSLWDYMHPDIYAFLIYAFSLVSILPMLTAYQKDLEQFQDRTPTDAFCQIPKTREPNITIPPGYTLMTLTGELRCLPDLERVENLRLLFANRSNIPPFAVIVMDINIVSNESVVVTMLVPEVSNITFLLDKIQKSCIMYLILWLDCT